MGQKVNPHGLRVGVIKDWDSRWFANKSDFGDTLVEDYNVRKFIKKNLYAAGVPKIEIERFADKVRIHIHCAKPGIVIGRGGAEIEKLKADGQDKLAAAEAGKLLKKAAAAGSGHARIAATGILLSLQKSPVAYAMKAMKDPARAYRNNVLRFAAPYADDAFYTELGATLGKLKDNEAKTDIVNYLGNQGAKTALPAILPYLKDADAELSEAAMWAATQIGGSEVPAAERSDPDGDRQRARPGPSQYGCPMPTRL